MYTWMKKDNKFKILLYNLSRRNEDTSGTAPQAGMLWFGFPMMPLEIFINIKFTAAI